MSGSQKKDQLQENDLEDDHALNELAVAVIESSREPNTNVTDAFESYVHKVHTSIYSNQDLFCSRFVQGYHTLLKELSKK